MIPIAMDVLEQPIWDTEDLARMGQRVGLFRIPIGGVSNSIWQHARTKDYWETNMLQQGMLDSPKEFIVRNIQVLLFDQSGPLPVFDRTGMGTLWAKSYLQFEIGMKPYWWGPLSLVADPVCLMGGVDALVKMNGDYPVLKNTLEMLNSQREHSLDCQIRCQEMFCVTVTPYTPVCRHISVRVVLNGKMFRPVL
jgi:hypothetical protein